MLSRITIIILSLLAYAATAQMVPCMEKYQPIKDGVEVTKVYTDSIITDTLTIQEFLEGETPKEKQSAKQMEESNERLRNMNEQMKKPE